ncbi:MAG: hypothetical protein PVG50_03545, partial [Thiohalophilus sp.]
MKTTYINKLSLFGIGLLSTLLVACGGDWMKQGEDLLNQYRPLTEQEIADGLKEALRVGSDRV